MPGGRPKKIPAGIDLDVTLADGDALEQELENAHKSHAKRQRVDELGYTRKPEDDLPSNALVPVDQAELIRLESANLATPIEQEISLAESGLSSTQLQAIELLADLVIKSTPQQVADRLGVHFTTIYAWISRPEFSRALRLRRQASFVELGAYKMMGVYDRELDKAKPGSRVLEQIGKALGFFSDNDQININIDVDATGQQTTIETSRDGSY